MSDGPDYFKFKYVADTLLTKTSTQTQLPWMKAAQLRPLG